MSFNGAYSIEIKNVNGHVEVFVDGKFSSSYDTLEEMIQEMTEEETA